LNCKDCKDSLYPTNPEIGYFDRRSGKYIRSLCHGCENSVGGKPRLEVEDMAARLSFLEEHDKPVDRHMRDNLQQLTGKVNYLDRLVKELQQVKKGKQGNEIISGS